MKVKTTTELVRTIHSVIEAANMLKDVQNLDDAERLLTNLEALVLDARVDVKVACRVRKLSKSSWRIGTISPADPAYQRDLRYAVFTGDPETSKAITLYDLDSAKDLADKLNSGHYRAWKTNLESVKIHEIQAHP